MTAGMGHCRRKHATHVEDLRRAIDRDDSPMDSPELACPRLEDGGDVQELRQLLRKRLQEDLVPCGAAKMINWARGRRPTPGPKGSRYKVATVTTLPTRDPHRPPEEERALNFKPGTGGFCSNTTTRPSTIARVPFPEGIPTLIPTESVERARLPQSRFYRPRSAPGGPGYSVQNRGAVDQLPPPARPAQSRRLSPGPAACAAAVPQIAERGLCPWTTRDSAFRIHFWPKRGARLTAPSACARLIQTVVADAGACASAAEQPGNAKAPPRPTYTGVVGVRSLLFDRARACGARGSVFDLEASRCAPGIRIIQPSPKAAEAQSRTSVFSDGSAAGLAS